MTEKYKLKVKRRDTQVKGKKYQNEGFILGNIFGLGKSQAIALPAKETRKLFHEIGESSVIYLTLDEDKKEIPVLLDETQADPLNGSLIHIALKKVDLKEKVEAAVAFEVIGEFSVPEALYLLLKQEVEVEALPTDLPESFILDVSKFTKIGEQITFADLEYDREKVTLLVEDQDEPVIIVSEVKEEIEEEPVVEEAAPAEGEAETVAQEETEESPTAEQK